MNGQADEPGRTISLRDTLRVVSRWKWLILAFVVVMTGAAFAYAQTRTPTYTATTELKYQQPVDISNPLGSPAYVDPNLVNLQLQSLGSELNGVPVRNRAAALLNVPSTDKQLTVSTSVLTNTAIVQVSAVSASPTMAARIANAFCAAFIANNRQREQGQLAQAIAVVQNRLTPYSSSATHASSGYLSLSQQLNALQIAYATVTGDYLVISPAVPPTSPSSPKPVREAALGAAAGLIAGIALAFVFQHLSTRLESYHEVGELLHAPVVARVPKLPQRLLAKDPLVVLGAPVDGATESFRELRNYLSVLARDEGLSTILVTSGLPGEGKSVTISNLALALAMGGKRVVLIDGNLREPRLHRIFNLDNELGLSAVVAGRTKLVDALKPVRLSQGNGPLASGLGGDGAKSATPVGSSPNLHVLPSGESPGSADEIVASGRFDLLLKELRASKVDFILIDSPALLEVSDAATMAAKVEGVLLVVDMESATKPVLADARESLDNLSCRTLGVVAVRERQTRERHRA